MSCVANQKVLVLNKSWAVVGWTTLEKAITKLFSAYPDGEPKARIINPDDYSRMTWDDWSKMRVRDGEEVIRSVNGVFRIPAVILLCRYDKMNEFRVKFSRRSIFKRDGFRCQYCGCNPGLENLSLDHIVPRSKGGLSEWSNVCACCTQCNFQKGNYLLEEAVRENLSKALRRNWTGSSPMRLLKKPTKPTMLVPKASKNTIKTWQQFMDLTYWNVELENDMHEDDIDIDNV